MRAVAILVFAAVAVVATKAIVRDIGIDLGRPVTLSPQLRSLFVAILIFLGVLTFAMTLRQSQCGPLTIGVSAIGGCDFIAGP